MKSKMDKNEKLVAMAFLMMLGWVEEVFDKKSFIPASMILGVCSFLERGGHTVVIPSSMFTKGVVVKDMAVCLKG